MAVLQEYRFQNVSELFSALYGPQTGMPAAAPIPSPAPPATASASYAPQQYQHPANPSQQFPPPPQHQQQFPPPPQHGHQQPQAHHSFGQPQTSAAQPPEKPGFTGWLKNHKVLVSICAAIVILLIIIIPGSSSGSPANNDDVTVTATPPAETATPPVEPEPPPAQVSLAGTWVMRDEDGYTAEFGFTDDGNRFYVVIMPPSEEGTDGIFIIEGTFSISGNIITATSTWGVESDGVVFMDSGFEEEIMSLRFSLSGQTLTIYEDDGSTEVFTGGQTLGVWSFNHRETVAIAEYVEDMPYVMTTDLASIPGYYTGYWLNDMPNGFGTFTNGESRDLDDYVHFIEGAFVSGTFIDGLVEGFAMGECPTSGASFFGYHVNGLRSGFGVYTWGNGDVYVGEWEKGLMNGEGSYKYFEDEYSLDAFWVDNYPVGDVVITFDDGTIYDGVIENGELVSITER
jgi:hypothetical protein